MRLLFDHNLSPRLTALLSDVYPGCTHVQFVGLERATDGAVWVYAREQDFTIVTRDSDFHERSLISGSPPKIVWIRRGNCSTTMIHDILRRHATEIEMLANDIDASCLVLI